MHIHTYTQTSTHANRRLPRYPVTLNQPPPVSSSCRLVIVLSCYLVSPCILPGSHVLIIPCSIYLLHNLIHNSVLITYPSPLPPPPFLGQTTLWPTINMTNADMARHPTTITLNEMPLFRISSAPHLLPAVLRP